jgi:poly(3-hydroxybutyrate) depolymerase
MAFRFLRGVVLLVALLGATRLLAVEGIPVGAGRVTVDVGLPLEVFTYKPPTYRDGPLLVIFHGVNRNAEDYRNFAITMGERFGAVVAAPLFDRERFPTEDYQQGGVLRDGKVRPRSEWTYSKVTRLVDGLRTMEGRKDMPFYFVGHSAGGQFVVRMVALAGALGAERVIAGNPGSHLFPTRDAQYGYGFGGLPDELSSDEAIRRYLAAPLTLYLGTADNDPRHASLDRSEAAMRQGRHRYERGLNCYEAARTLAAQRGWDFNWRKVETAGIAHDAAKMFAADEAKDAVFGESNPGRAPAGAHGSAR